MIANPTFGFLVSESRRRLHLGGEQPARTSSRPGPTTRSATRRARRSTSATRRPASSGARRRCPIRDERSPYVVRHGQGYSRFEHDAPRHRARPAAVRADRRPGQDLAPDASRIAPGARGASPSPPTSSGCSARRAARPRPSSSRRSTRRPARCSPATPGTSTSRGRVAFADLGGRQHGAGPATARVPGPQRRARRAPRRSRAARRSRARRRRPRSRAPRCRPRSTLPPGGAAEVVFFLGQARDAAEARAPGHALPRRTTSTRVLRTVARALGRLLGAVQVKTPDASLDLLLNRWLLYQALACRLWARAGVLPGQRRVRLPRPAPGRDGARRGAAAIWRASSSCAPRRASSSRATCSTGGTRPPGAASARASPTTCSGCPTPSTHYLEVTGDTASSTRSSRSSRRRCSRPTQHEAYFAARACRAEPATLFEHCARALDRSLAVGRHGLPLMGTGDWNDGMNRVGPEGKGESVWLGWFLHAILVALRAPRRATRRDGARARAGASTPTRSQGALESRLGRRLVPARLLRRRHAARLRRERRVPDRLDRAVLGASSPARRDPARARARDGGGRGAPGPTRRRPHPAVHAAVRPRRRSTRLHQGLPARHPRERRPVHARRALGRARVRGARATATRRASCSRSSTRSTTPAPAPACTATRSSRTSWPPTSTPTAPHVGRGGWTWYTGSAGWMYRAASSGSSASACTAAALHARSLHPARLARLRDQLPLSLRALRDRAWRTRAA